MVIQRLVISELCENMSPFDSQVKQIIISNIHPSILEKIMIQKRQRYGRSPSI
jgi:hypothetical protein